jgi:hypothetical protein
LQHSSELDLIDAQKPSPVRLIPEAVLERALRIVLAEIDVDRFGVAGFDERVETHRRSLTGVRGLNASNAVYDRGS